MSNLLIGLGCFVVILILWAYIINLKDVYYAYGRAIALKYQGKATITYDEHKSIRFKFPKGGEEIYIMGLGKSVYKLLKKDGIITEEDYKPLNPSN